MGYGMSYQLSYRGGYVTLTLIDAPLAKLETPIRQRYRVLNEWDHPLGYVESPRDGIWVARNRTEASNGDMVRWRQTVTQDEALRCLLDWHTEDLHSAEEPDPLAPAGGQIIPDPRVAIEPTPTGIALRDWFAGMVLQGIFGNPGTLLPVDQKKAALIAYNMADAMMMMMERDHHG